VIVDSLWGEPAVAAMGAATRFGRHVQVGHLAGPELGLAAPAIRSKSLDVRGFMGLHPPPEVRREAYARLGGLVARGEIVIDVERVPLADVASAWHRHSHMSACECPFAREAPQPRLAHRLLRVARRSAVALPPVSMRSTR
jgi:NADPH2:quinone reductase